MPATPKFKIGDIVVCLPQFVVPCGCTSTDRFKIYNGPEVHGHGGGKVIYSGKFLSGVNKGQNWSFYDFWMELETPLSPEEQRKKKQEQVVGKINRLWEKQKWVQDGKPSATSYITQPAPSVESLDMTEAETTLQSTPTATPTAFDVAMEMGWGQGWTTVEETLNQMMGTTQAPYPYTTGRTQSQINPILGFAPLTVYPSRR